MITPPPLNKGDSIGIIAPARSISKSELAPAFQIFENWGLNVNTGKNVFEKFHQFAGKDEKRRADLQEMIDNPKIKAVFCARGGYGTVRTIQNIKWNKLTENPKWIIGYSDITTLHSFVNQKLQIKTIHGTMPLNFPSDGKEDDSLLYLKKILFGEKIQIKWKPEFKEPPKEKAEGILTGGNLSVLYSLIGTPYDIETKDKVLFLEDLDEYLYHIDRMMMNLKLSGKLDKCRAIVVGGMTDMNDNSTSFGKTANEIIEDVTNDIKIPVFYNCPVGHLKTNLPLVLGEEIKLGRENNKIKITFNA